MSERSWMGQLAIKQNLVPESQIDEAEAAAREAGVVLGDVLVERGLLDDAGVAALRLAMRELLDDPGHELRIAKRDEALQGRILVNWEMASSEQVREGLETVLLAAGEGLERPLGEVMVELGYLTPHQQYKLVHQRQMRMRCMNEDVTYDVLGYEQGLQLRCPSCKGVLVPAADEGGEASKQLVYDKDQAEDLALIGRLALKSKLITKEQLSKAVRTQARAATPGTRIGQILLKLGMLDKKQLKGLEKEKKRLQKQKRQEAIDAFGSTNIGAIGLQKGFFDQGTLQLMLEEQKKLSAEGAHRRLGELMIEAGFLTNFQLMRLLSLQSKTIVVCNDCGTQLNAQGLADDAEVKCPDCGAAMDKPDKVETVEALRTMNFDLSQLVAMDRTNAPQREMREAVPTADAIKRGATRIIQEALEDTRHPKGAPAAAPRPAGTAPVASPKKAGVQMDQLEQTISLFDYAATDGDGPAKRKNLDQQALHDWARRCLKRNPVWQVTAAPGYWFCPYCGVAVKPDQASKDYLSAILRHLAASCEIFGAVSQPPVFPLSELKRRATYLFVKEQLRRDPAWHIRDRSNRWVNPYTLKVTDVDLSAGRITRQAADQITAQIAEMRDWNPGRPPARKSREDIVAGVAKAFTVGQLTRKVAKLVKENPAWQVTDERGNWVCPFARAVTTIRADSPFALQHNAPPRIAEYLIDDCQEFREKKPAAKSPEELRAAIAPTSEAAEAPSTISASAFADAFGVTPESLGVDELDSTLARAKVNLEGQLAAMEKELGRAAKKTAAMLPDLPEIEGLDFHVHFVPLEGIGGDFYDFYKLPDGQLGLAIGDVSGHGVDAAMVMTMAKKTLKMVARQSSSPKRALVLANEEIRMDLDGRTFVTMWYGMLDPTSRRLRCSRAGHEPLLVFNPERSPSMQVHVSEGMTAGITSGAKFEKLMGELEIELRSGDIGLLYTDGISEIANSAGEQFGRERIEAVLRGCAGASAEEVVRALVTAVDGFKGEAIDDDQTIIVFVCK